MNHAHILLPNGRIKTVRNLGWLLRNWQNISHLEWANLARDYQTMTPDGIFRAYMRDGRVYATPYASFAVWKHFINRPVFRGLPVVVNGIGGTV